MKEKISVAIVGYGNIGQYALQALQAAPDMEVAGIVRRKGAEDCPAELAPYKVVKSLGELEGVDVAILATPTRSVEKYALEALALGIINKAFEPFERQLVADAVWARLPRDAGRDALFD